MKIVGWNSRGLGNGLAVRGLLDLQKREDPDILFLSETKMDRRRLEWLRWKLGMTQMMVKDCVGSSGGLVVFWKKELNVTIDCFISKYHIDMEVQENDGFVWRFTGIYGEPKTDDRDKTWQLLRILKQRSNKPWLVVGDFNEILHPWEKEGGVPKPQRQMDKFKEALEVCDLRDLGFSGDAFTWRNHSHTAASYIKERLDRAVATQAWCDRFPGFKVINGDPRHSDHRPVIVDTHGACRRRQGRDEGGVKRFEANWIQEDGCEGIIRNAWEREVRLKGETIAGALRGVLGELVDWNRNILGDLEKRIKKSKKELEKCRREGISGEQVRREELLRFKLSRLEDQRDTYWKQRAHVNWMTNGDRNTKYFHMCASERKRKNRITNLKKEDGRVVSDKEEIKEAVTSYFTNLFFSTAGTRMAELESLIPARVSGDMNEMLTKTFTAEEVRAALDSIGDLKAPGPDGMPAAFYKKYWHIVGEQVTREVLIVLHGGELPADWNETCVVLIPKVKDPDKMKDLRPISLCNVVYKLVSKVLANRLKQILPDLISPNQSAFVPGRLITDNILLAYECTHYMRTRKKGSNGYAAVKLDMSKAYDRVEWHFLEMMMRRMGFNERWIGLIMCCVNSVQYRVKVNESLTDVILPERGLRQGDPLSPYLFLICAEGFSALLNNAEENGRLQGIKICPNAPSFNHLLFADDSMVLLKSTEQCAQHLQEILNLYENCSGQTINFDKSAVMFSHNTPRECRTRVLRALNITSIAWSEKYLGLPVYVGRSRAKTFEYLKERIWKRIQGWKERALSKAGKDVLIKACAQAIPTFAMSCFDLTKTLCDQMSTMICRYWWAQQENENKMHWLSWEKLTKPKKEGGLGFRDLHSFNIAMLTRQAWRLLMEPESMCARVLSAKYFPNGNVLTAVPTEGMSYTWRSILKGVDLLKEGLIWRVGNGLDINIWTDPWINREGLRVPVTPRRQNLVTKVAELINPISGTWDEALVQDIFWSVDAAIILATPIRDDMEDFCAWYPDTKGVFTVKSAYKIHNFQLRAASGNPREGCQPDPIWEKIWALPCPMKIKQFVWRLTHDSLPLRINIKRRGVKLDPICPVCQRLDEVGAHTFLKCKVMKNCWRMLYLEDTRQKLTECANAREMVWTMLNLSIEKKLKALILCWQWWDARNKINAGDKARTAEAVCKLVHRWVSESKEFFLKGTSTTEKQALKWKKPRGDTIKINTDGAYFPGTTHGGWGFIARDADGDVRGSGFGHLKNIRDALRAEAEACLRALHAAASWGISNLHIETDSTTIAEALHSSKFDRTNAGVIFKDARAFMRLNFVTCVCSFSPRTCNGVAHKLAAMGASSEPDSFYLLAEAAPADVNMLLTSDRAGSSV